ncbi:hypothetical protein AVEN_263587-1 [Araneus ventricosus]|uniref:Uncharacterized protein n=1 Tax=Araneus ventricosus TaxID=182803 RepID=A0A4Y2HZZ5_ARAVE|nr:hypothetical protein AVEN_263587-1 [Araneus ventricosus]
MMGQDPVLFISPIPGDECVLLCSLMCEILHYRSRTKFLEAYHYSCKVVVSVRSFGTHLHLFLAIKSVPSVRHFRSNEEVRQDVKNFISTLDTDFYKDGFLKLSSRYDKFINVGGEHVEK